jgi:putative oxidoreductase
MAPYGPTLLRLAAGLVFVAHGVQKLFGFGEGGGLTATAALFAQVGLAPAFVLAMMIGLIETFGGLLLLSGLFTRIAAGLFTIEMLVAIWKVHLANGFFLNWGHTTGVGHGYEFNLVLIGVLVSLMLTGPGALSIDRSKAREAEIQAASRARLRSGDV